MARSGRLKCGRTAESVAAAEELTFSQEDQPQTHRSTRWISRETDLSQSSIVRSIHRDLRLKCLKTRRAQGLSDANRVARLSQSKQLLNKILSQSYQLRVVH